MEIKKEVLAEVADERTMELRMTDLIVSRVLGGIGKALSETSDYCRECGLDKESIVLITLSNELLKQARKELRDEN
jgi:hypothetical protein